MRRLTFIIAMIMIFASCDNETKTKEVSDTHQEKTEATNEKVVIKNKSDYAPEFIEEFKTQPFSKAVLDGNSITVDGEKSSFPENPAFGKTIELKGEKDGLTVILKIKRKNQTTIEYNITMMEKGKGLTKFNGDATISASFYWGLESDESSISQTMYSADEYLDYEDEKCYTSIRLGKEDDKSDNPLIGKLIKNCNGEIRAIDLDDFPTLVQ